MLQLILGGARSGKSRLAEKLASDSPLAVTYIATSQPLDGEMNQRVAHHRARRPAEWALIEEPLELARVLRESAGAERFLYEGRHRAAGADAREILAGFTGTGLDRNMLNACLIDALRWINASEESESRNARH